MVCSVSHLSPLHTSKSIYNWPIPNVHLKKKDFNFYLSNHNLPTIAHLKVHLLNIDLGADLAKGAARVQLHFAGIIPGGGKKNLWNHVYSSVLNIR